MLGAGRSIQLVRIFGIRIGASPSWFVVLFFSIYFLNRQYEQLLGPDGPHFLAATAAAGLFFGSLLLHELGHAVQARREGIEIDGIDLWFFGGVAKLSRDSETPGEEVRVAAAGPAVTALIILTCAGVTLLVANGTAFWDAVLLRTTDDVSVGLALAAWLATINTILLVFNLIPAFPLDGGRIARSIAWKVTGDKTRGTVFSARLGQLFGWGLVAYGVFQLLQDDNGTINGLWTAMLGFFLAQAAKSAVVQSAVQERLEGITASDLMDREPVTMPGGTSALDATETYFARYRWPWFAVVDAAGRFSGVLFADRAEEAVAGGRPAVAVAELLEPAETARFTVNVRTPLEHLLTSSGLAQIGAVVVCEDDGRLAGVITLEQVRRALTAAAPGPAS
jgi:Zn-dependent protease